MVAGAAGRLAEGTACPEGKTTETDDEAGAFAAGKEDDPADEALTTGEVAGAVGPAADFRPTELGSRTGGFVWLPER